MFAWRRPTRASRIAIEHGRQPALEAAIVDLHRRVRDTGAGFDPLRTKRGSGLQNMQDRLEALGGSLEVRSAPSVGVDTFSGRFTKTVTLAAGTYEFSAGADDGVRVLVDGVSVIDRWVNDGPSSRTGSATLTAGEHTIVVEYYENFGGAAVQAGYALVAAPVSCAAGEWSVEWFDGNALAGARARTMRCE